MLEIKENETLHATVECDKEMWVTSNDWMTLIHDWYNTLQEY